MINPEFVRKAYLEILHREPSKIELQTPLPPTTLLLSLFYSREWREKHGNPNLDDMYTFITQAYLEILHREPNPDEMRKYMLALMAHTKSRGQILYELFTGTEAQAHIPTLETTHVKDLPHTIDIFSTKDVNCGIALYSKYLAEALSKITDTPCNIHSLNELGKPMKLGILHLQHEYGIAPSIIHIRMIDAIGKIVTWHTVNPRRYVEHIIFDDNVDMHIVHMQAQAEILKRYVRKPIHIIPHGSRIYNIPTHVAREKLGLPKDKTILFYNGFSSEGKMYWHVVKAIEKLPNVILIILGSPHFRAKSQIYVESTISYAKGLHIEHRVKIIGRFLPEEELDLYCSASDIHVFNYQGGDWVSASGAMHRVLSSGKPIICTYEDTRLSELGENIHALKYHYGDIDDLTHKITMLMENRELSQKLGENCRKLAEETSWENVAKLHLKLYSKIMEGA
jgi:glycosyltransferase involved in cell wall biosynthesis